MEQMNYPQDGNRLIDIEKKLVIAKGRGVGRDGLEVSGW